MKASIPLLRANGDIVLISKHCCTGVYKVLFSISICTSLRIHDLNWLAAFNLNSITPHQNTHDNKDKKAKVNMIFFLNQNKMAQNKLTSLKEFSQRHHLSSTISVL